MPGFRLPLSLAFALVWASCQMPAREARAADPPPARDFTLAEALAAVARAPEAAAAADDTRAANGRIDAAGPWPVTGLALSTATRTARLGMAVSLGVPLPGEREPERAVARAAATRVGAEGALTNLSLKHDVTVAWLELARLEARAQLADEAVERADQLARVAAHRFDQGDAPRVDEVTAKTRAARAEVDAASAHRDVEAASALLAGKLALDPLVLLHAAPGLPDAPESPPSLPALRAQSHGHPLLRAADGSVSEAEAEVRGASRARWPQLAFVVGADAFDPTLDGTDWHVGVDLQLPLGGKQGAKEQAATASEEAARNRRRAAAARVDASVVASYRALQAASGRLVALDQKIVPAEREAERLARLAYEEGESDLTSVLTAERGLAEVEADLVDARAALAMAHADLDLAVGGAR